jgi:hypothetical protein
MEGREEVRILPWLTAGPDEPAGDVTPWRVTQRVNRLHAIFHIRGYADLVIRGSLNGLHTETGTDCQLRFLDFVWRHLPPSPKSSSRINRE